MGSWASVRTADGSWTLAHPRHAQTCHSRSGAWLQARERYALPCALAEREGGAVCLLDVGTGLGLNLAAALWALESAKGAVRFTALSVEIDPLVLECAARLEGWPEPVERFHARVRPLLSQAARAGSARLELEHGGSMGVVLADARDWIHSLPRAPTFDAVFLDPFSPSVESGLWEGAFLAALAARMRAGALLSTYSSSFRVRLGLARAGLCIGRGPRVGTKSSGTLAGKPPLVRPLPELEVRTARRLARAISGGVRGPSNAEIGRMGGVPGGPVD